MLNDLRGYLQLANGLSDVTKAKAKEIAMELVNQGIALSTKRPTLKAKFRNSLMNYSRRVAITAKCCWGL